MSDFNLTTLTNGNAGIAQTGAVTTKAFVLNLATGFGLFVFQLSGFFLLKSSKIGRRIYQPKTYLVQDRLRVEAVPVNPLKWITRIFKIQGEELKLKCGLDGYFAIRFLRAMILIFVPLMVVIVTILLPINYNGGKDDNTFTVEGQATIYNITGLDTLSWQNVAPTNTDRYWAHLLSALGVIAWTLYRIYREKLHFIAVRQEFLTSPEHRLRASARTLLVTNIPSEYRSDEALKALFDVFVDNDDRERLRVWVNRDYGDLRKLVNQRRSACHALEKEELKMLRLVNKRYRKADRNGSDRDLSSSDTAVPEASLHGEDAGAEQHITAAYEIDCEDKQQLWRQYLKESSGATVSLVQDANGDWKTASSIKFWQRSHKKVPKIAWLRKEVARLTVQIDALQPELDNEARFKLQNSAFIQFDRQMSANMACALITHHKPGLMAPRYMDVAPHEIVWANMGLTSMRRFVRTCIALMLFIAMLIIWAIPATFLGILSQLDTLRKTTSYLAWLKPCPSWVISLISGPLTAILLALLVQLVVPALCRKLAVLVGAPTRSRREIVTQAFYFTFLLIELVLVTSISSGLIATISSIINNPTSIVQKLANELPKASNYFFNYLIIQALGYSGSLLFQYLRLLFITLIWPWFTQTPRQEAFLQTTIPHQMWGNVFAVWTNFAAIGLIYSIISPLILIFISCLFMLFWVAYRHNYYYVQRNKVDTHGLLFENALSQLFAGVYIMEITLIGLFFLVRNSAGNVACSAQAIIMIVAIILTAGFHYTIEQTMRPLTELLPVTLEDKAAEAEKELLLEETRDRSSYELDQEAENAGIALPDAQVDNKEEAQSTAQEHDHKSHRSRRRHLDQRTSTTRTRGKTFDSVETAANARKTLLRLERRVKALASHSELQHLSVYTGTERRMEAGNQLGEALSHYPDELIDLSPAERQAELRAAYQDPVTREPTPIVWIPQDVAGVSDDAVKSVRKYGKHLTYSNEGAFLTARGHCEVVRPAPDVRTDWLLDWVL
ncbi:unnamed protein product [Zymoseptoria tritici ST99CH_1A5]|uniref:DUF221-domain-containing protein n=3 Tax=Zymoseptoria tritici TaxID=1047171 RepID=A0A1X7RX79_ZYMT9|nr:unnamed protein product [Zymoseptoria tritici ST99CH_3D7]SMR53675.1 unnamed protein product [Zymoseptoria tritici ST99CH_1E4]SMR56028.1 unnamed protein product [Zymoseptoria tritici ST99CH_3D1]SMY25207.1 unnamed protein product [Zymoseptoria tritici ST99CH_1A5]